MNARVGAATDVGAVRTSNEDSHFTGERVFVVADGMGGHAAGEVASAMAVSHLGTLDSRPDLGPEDIRQALITANDAIRDAAVGGRAGMGTTATGLVSVTFAGSPHWVVFNVGDSRVYRFAEGALTMLTADHSEAAEMVAAGTLTEDQARNSPFRNVITRALGAYRAPEPDQWVCPPIPGERFLLCSDGLTGEVEDDEIASVLASTPNPAEAADTLVRRAVQAGGRDNVTVVVVDGPTPPPAP
ncbi:protein phosphatase 2C domain-containing protein [Actinosynnema sp. NPDC020468]|uniref:PP2C family protein-serine/threonine phosphatase n=1 Tax=Actinosynnema sp. NPDC020468 TaxID=3154488 RepID=UPI0033DAAE30